MSEINPPGQSKPDVFDGFGFFIDKLTGIVNFYYFDDVVKVRGESPKDPTIPADREAYHVMLSSVKKNTVYLDAPFVSCFIDPFVYAKNLAQAGFSGIMMKKNQWSANVVAQSMAYVRQLHHLDRGYMFIDEDGTETFYPGVKANT